MYAKISLSVFYEHFQLKFEVVDVVFSFMGPRKSAETVNK